MNTKNTCYNSMDLIINVDKAKKLLMNFAPRAKDHEYINLDRAADRVLAQTIRSQIDLPTHDNSAVDGYAFNFENFLKYKEFKIVGESLPGKPFSKNLKSGQAIKIYTGALILNKRTYKHPINTVVMKEEISEKREEELRGAIDLHGEDSSRDEKNMLKSILDLDEITVGSIMIPRKDIFSLPANINFNNLIEKLEESPHSRIPIWEKNPENIIGVFHVRRLISQKNPDPKKFNIKLLCQKPWFIPESTKLDNQLMEFKKRKEHFSIVVDEYGEFLGIVTLEDIIEEIVGDIDDEQDMLKISKKVKGIKSLSPSNFLVKGNVSIRDLNKELNINLPINNNVSTIAGLVLYESRTIPKTKQIFSFFDLKFEILNKTNNQITLLKISKKKD